MTQATTYRQPWVRGPVFDTLFLLLPPFLSLVIVAILPAQFTQTNQMPVAGWCVLVLFVDVAHVYSTLYNTYFDKPRFNRHKPLFLLTPVLCYLAGVCLYLVSGMVFWHILTYLAVFHFVRQQYGFMRIYAHSDRPAKWKSGVDTVTIYATTLYPLVYWHCTPGRNFNWFMPNDFFIAGAPVVKTIAGYCYFLILATYVWTEIRESLRSRTFNLPKNIIVAGTALSWYFGIIYFNGDLAFTLLNTVSHGIPYMALVWADTVRRQQPQHPVAQKNKPLISFWYGILIFMVSLVVFAYIEEGFWDGLVWRDHTGVFKLFSALPQVSAPTLLAFLVPLLSLPQSTHYVLDGFIWRRKYQ